MQGRNAYSADGGRRGGPVNRRPAHAYKLLKVPAKDEDGQAPGKAEVRPRSNWSRTMVRKSLGDAPACLVKKREK